MKKLINLFIITFFFCNIQNIAFSNNCNQAEGLIRKAQTASNIEESYEYLHQAEKLFLEDYNENPIDIKTNLNLSKVYQLLGYRKEAKLYVLKAYNLNPYSPDIQKAMGDFFYNFQEYSTAIEYYKLSLASGNLEDFETNMQAAKCFEKLGDTKSTELYFSISNYINPSSKTASTKLNQIQSSYVPDNSAELDDLKYKYLFKDKIKTTEEQEKEEIDDILEKLYFNI